MADVKKPKLQSKTVKFQNKTLTLYSLDGMTWSSRKDELMVIAERHEQERLAFGEIRGQMSVNKPIAPKRDPNKFKYRRLQNEQGEAPAHPVEELRARKEREQKEEAVAAKLAQKQAEVAKKAAKIAAKKELKKKPTAKPAVAKPAKEKKLAAKAPVPKSRPSSNPKATKAARTKKRVA